MLLLLSLSLVIIFSFIVTSLFSLRSTLSKILSCYLLGMANVILVAEIAGLVNLVANAWFFVCMHFILVISAGIFWTAKGKPKLFTRFNTSIKYSKLIEAYKQNPILWTLAFGVICAYLINAILILLVHANTNDSLAVHLARIGYWLQFSSYRPWPTANIYQITYPFNAQVQMLWTILLSGTDQLVEFVQWFGAIFGIIAITGIGKILGYSQKQGIFAGLIWATFPMIFLQSTTTQNDLITATVALIGIYFLFYSIKNWHIPHLVLSGLAFGIVLGIKQTAFFIIPGLGFAFILFLIKFKRKIWRYLLIFAGITIVSFLLLGSYIYFSNIFAVPVGGSSTAATEDRQIQTPFGPSEFVAHNMGLNNRGQIADSLLINSSRYLFQAADPTGLPSWFKGPFVNFRESIARFVFSTLNIPIESDRAIGGHVFTLSYMPIVHEDVAWFGLLGFLLLFIAFVEVGKAVNHKNVFAISLFFIALSALLGILVFRNIWTPYQGRYMVTVFSCLAPFYGSIYFSQSTSKNRFKQILLILIIIFAIGSSLIIIWNNEGKPLSSPRATLLGNRLTHYKYSGGYLVNIVEMVNEYVPSDATLGLAIGRSWEYPFFGENLTRTLIPVYPSTQLYNEDWLLDQNIEYILIDASQFDPEFVPEIFHPITSFDDFVILMRDN